MKECERQQEQQFLFARTLTELLRDGITYVGEEIDAKSRSIAQELAQRFHCSYDIIDMPLSERKLAECPPDYALLYQLDRQGDILLCHRLRERYMCRRVVESLSDGGRGLVLCGNVHAARLRNDLAERLSHVELKSLGDYPWFDKQLYEWDD
jgi:hypothetical protein